MKKLISLVFIIVILSACAPSLSTSSMVATGIAGTQTGFALIITNTSTKTSTITEIPTITETPTITLTPTKTLKPTKTLIPTKTRIPTKTLTPQPTFTPWDDSLSFLFIKGISCSYGEGCSHIEIFTRDGCPTSLYVEVAFFDSNDVQVDWGNDTASSLAPGGTALLEFVTFNSSVTKVQITKISCY
jgi:hypothetical protein